MNIAALILNRLTVIYATLTDQGWQYRILETGRVGETISIRSRWEINSPSDWPGKKHKHPTVLILAGKGIVSKEYPKDDPGMKRIVSRPDEFVFAVEEASDKQRLTFMRRRQYEEALAGLSVWKQPFLGVRMDPEGDPGTEALAAADDFFNHTLSFRKMLKASPGNSTLLSLMADRLLLPVLGLFLAVLLVNFLVQQNLQKQLQEQQFLLSRLQQTAAVRDKQQGQQQLLQNLLLPEPRYPYAQIADRIGSLVPAGVVLTELTIQPVLKKIQENKPLQIEPNRVLIRGEAVSAAPVTQLTDTLRKWDVRHSVQLLSLIRDRNDRYRFEIDVRL